MSGTTPAKRASTRGKIRTKQSSNRTHAHMHNLLSLIHSGIEKNWLEFGGGDVDEIESGRRRCRRRRSDVASDDGHGVRGADDDDDDSAGDVDTLDASQLR